MDVVLSAAVMELSAVLAPELSAVAVLASVDAGLEQALRAAAARKAEARRA